MSAKAQAKLYVGAGIGLSVLAVMWVLFGDTSSLTFEAAEGISVFAALYVIAQSAERVTEWVVDLLSLLPASPEKRKEEALREVRSANSTLNGNPTLADIVGPAEVQAVVAKKEGGEEKVQEARRDIKFLAHGVSLAVCAVAVNGLNYGFLRHIGADPDQLNEGLDRLFTVVAAAGGTKGLHELIGRMQSRRKPQRKNKALPIAHQVPGALPTWVSAAGL